MSTRNSRRVDESHCARCLRVPGPQDFGYDPGDADSIPLDWEVLTGSDGEAIGVICADCITPEEQQALDEDTFNVMDAMRPGDGTDDEQ